ncbi:alkylated DNA repair protein [Arsenicicoccus piscis]|uniref:Alkylated DNA repair protein n=2 Tax=Arsenicicoccus piscis TaxID=673954 RepID=A0ABQ6HPH8_9MICO|nr:alkylated DNA repair protein [Arsenicicoccus piscis]
MFENCYASAMMSLQGSLLDLAEAPRFGRLGDTVQRTSLTLGAWVDHRPGWLAGSDALFDELVEGVPWHAERRQMYDREVDVPRLTKFYGSSEQLPHPMLDEARDRLNAHYQGELGEPLTSAGLCLYRSGADSVAWHGDTIGRGSTEDTMVAIVSIGDARTLALRPRGGSTAHRFALGHGDLVVMGGSCQRTWEHAIPKTAQHVGPRISIQFRPKGVR